MLSKLLRWARITAPGDDSNQFEVQQMDYNGKVADGLIVFPYGIHGNVPADALALMFAVQGNPENRAAIAWTPKDRPELEAGEVAFYHPPTDAFIIWRASGELDIETGGSGTADINLKAATVNMNVTQLNVIGNTEFTGTVKANGKVIDDTHGHTQGNDSDGDVEAAISGVT